MISIPLGNDLVANVLFFVFDECGENLVLYDQVEVDLSNTGNVINNLELTKDSIIVCPKDELQLTFSGFIPGVLYRVEESERELFSFTTKSGDTTIAIPLNGSSYQFIQVFGFGACGESLVYENGFEFGDSPTVPVHPDDSLALKKLNQMLGGVVGWESENVSDWRNSLETKCGRVVSLGKFTLYNSFVVRDIPGTFAELKFLERLDLSPQGFWPIFSGEINDSLGLCLNLKYLNLAGNWSIDDTLPRTFENLTQLDTLILDGVYIKGDPSDVINNLDNLKYASFAYCNISEFKSDLSNLSRLQSLNLQGNQISSVDPDILRNNPNLDSVDFSYNKLFFDQIKLLRTNFNDGIYFPQKSLDILDSTAKDCALLGDEYFLKTYINEVPGLSFQWINRIYDDNLQREIDMEVENQTSPTLTFIPTTNNSLNLYLRIRSADFQDSVQYLVSEAKSVNVFSNFSEQDSLKLVEFYENMNGENWTNQTGWLVEGERLDKWEGIGTNCEKVSKIILPNNQISGDLGEVFVDLYRMDTLDLSNNSIKDTSLFYRFPSSLVYLDMSNNQVEAEIGKVTTTYQWGDFDDYPFQYFSDMVHFDFSHNKLFGEIERRNFSRMAYLEYLDLSNNQFEGGLPFLYKSFIVSRGERRIESGDDYYDTIVPSSVKFLNFSNNSFQDTIPEIYQALPNLEVLILEKNRLSSGFTKKYTTYFPKLKSLDLDSNNFSSSIELESISDILQLESLSMASNSLSGNLPFSLSKLKKLKFLNFAGNSFDSLSLSNMDSLKTVNFEGNNLKDVSSLSSLNNLKSLNLRDNKLLDLFQPNQNQKLDTLRVENNGLDFADLEPFAVMLPRYFTYAPQNLITKTDTVKISQQQTLRLNSLVPGQFNTYQWFKNDTLISGANQAVYLKRNGSFADTGVYHCVVSNTLLPELQLTYHRFSVIPCLTNTPRPTLELNTNQVSCVSTTLFTNSTSTKTYWYLNDFLVVNDTLTTYQAVSSGDYVVEITDTAGCVLQSNPRTVSINVQGTFMIGYDGVTINTTQTGNFQWFVNGMVIANQRNSNITPRFNGTYQLEIENPVTGCKSKSNTVVINRSDLLDVGRGAVVQGNTVFMDDYKSYLSPNPTRNDYAELQMAYPALRTIKIFDMAGTEKAMLNTLERIVILPSNQLGQGMYVVEIIENEKTERLKWIIQK
ncbi:MAG: T9SS type A sorting domain-containing protein [Cytophagales bacterium]